ncbi:MAG TPA: PQQ-dependent sugar dehydrogenase [Vicinamibacterales bacterium]
MGSHQRLAALLLVIGLPACGPSSPQPTPAPATNQPVRINGTEHLAWNESVASRDQLGSLRFFALVDGKSWELAGVSCDAVPVAEGYACSSPLPPMSVGPHTIQLIAFNGLLESEPSSPLLSVIVVTGSTALASAGVSAGGSTTTTTSITTSDGVTLRLDPLAHGLSDVTDVALAPGDRIFVAERAGRIRLYRDGGLQPEPAATLSQTISSGGELLALAVDPQFSGNHRVYGVHTTAPRRDVGTTLGFTLTRFVETGGTLVDPVVLLSEVPATSGRAAAALRFGPDSRLYAAFDDGGNEHLAGDVASFNGKVLRLNPDGSTPEDQAGASPVFAQGIRSPRGLAWPAAGGMMWVADAAPAGQEQLTPFVNVGDRPMRTQSRQAYRFPEPVGVRGIAPYGAALVPQFRGDLFVAADEGRSILRVRFDPADPLTIASTERLLADRVGGIRAVAIGTDGAIYFATTDTLARLVPVSAPPAALARSRRH